jgi:hypothetical protein
MNKFNFAAFVAAIVLFASCDKASSFVGLDYEEMPVQEQPSEEIKPDNPKKETLSTDDSTNDSVPEEVVEEVPVSDEIEKILPPEWGDVIGADISAVPADDDDIDIDKRCLIIRTQLGAATVIYSREEALPEIADIVVANFTEGNFDESYDSAVFAENNWVPASAFDSKDRLEYSVSGVVKRNLRYSTLKKWDWQNKDSYYSTKVSGYDIEVEDGVLTIIMDGEQKLHIR